MRGRIDAAGGAAEGGRLLAVRRSAMRVEKCVLCVSCLVEM